MAPRRTPVAHVIPRRLVEVLAGLGLIAAWATVIVGVDAAMTVVPTAASAPAPPLAQEPVHAPERAAEPADAREPKEGTLAA